MSPTKPNWCSEGCNQISYMGIYDAIKGFGADYFVKHDSAIQQLIEMQANATPPKVGLPSDVVRIDPVGSQWLHRKPFCADEN